jgi:hypothetical protein
MNILFQIIGGLGLFLILCAFFFMQRGKITNKDLLYNILNSSGGVLLGTYSVYYKAWFSVILNVLWVLVAIFYLYKNKEKIRGKVS